MLVIANGAYKNGSTWLFNVIRELTGYPPPPTEYLDSEWVNPSIREDKLADFLATLDSAGQNHLVKNHFYKRSQRDLLLEHPQVYVLNIERDLRDALVSAYYHARRNQKSNQSFEDYYYLSGRNRAASIINYHRLWNTVDSPRFLLTSYETFHSDFASELQRIAAFLKQSVSEADIERIQQATSLNQLREKYGEQDAEDKFFRKGVVGDWQNHFDETLLADLEQLQQEALQEPGYWQQMKNRLAANPLVAQLKRTITR